MASQNGTTNRIRMETVMTVTASQRLFHSQACTRRIRAHVEITSIAAQMTAGRNGWSIQTHVPISAAMKRTPRVTRVRSLRTSLIAIPPRPYGCCPRCRRLADGPCRLHDVDDAGDDDLHADAEKQEGGHPREDPGRRGAQVFGQPA